MKQFKEIFLGIVIILAFGWIITFIYKQESAKSNKELARRVAELSPRRGPPETIDGLRQVIALYEDQVERNVREGAQTGVYWKILATRLTDGSRPQYNAALDALERAIYYNNDDPVLFYLTGVSAANVAKSKVGFSGNAQREAEQYYKLSENGYLRALELDITYTKAMYGLAILYVYELERPGDAIVYLERILQIEPSNIQAMFVLATAHYLTENFNQAIEVYDRIITRTRNKKEREEAELNRDIIMGLIYG
ncbi:MAG: tetratricopeptide repeat protein [Treponema sp.]|jgi:tetratricopeptide (TPR) repeat protein|nr:tetratricopeptide repeat protein [Treponema sp.]